MYVLTELGCFDLSSKEKEKKCSFENALVREERKLNKK